ncbi:Outer membrane protein W [Durusdinium trenchii]|uniref:Outer membrane protein W n=1 Tax=Durusdinium trenchii TaxID=1381693 RepID=A0ABP0L2L0_9DINO
MAYEAGDLIVKFGPALVAPDSDSTSKQLGLPGEPVEVDDGVGIGISGTYMMTDTVGLEILGASPFEHDIDGGLALANTRVGSTEHLPPTVLVNYFPPLSEKIKPYVGLGYNYTFFFNEDTTAEFDGLIGGLLGTDYTSLSLSDSHGLAYEIGVDIPLEDNLVFTATVWNIDIDTVATVKANGNTIDKIDVEIDPWVYMVGIGIKF